MLSHTPPPRGKIEFWVNQTDKDRFAILCKQAGYTIAETMRRAFDERMETLVKKQLVHETI